MLLFILSLGMWVASLATGFLALGGVLLTSKEEKALPGSAYLILALIFATVSFSIFYNLGGPRQW